MVFITVVTVCQRQLEYYRAFREEYPFAELRIPTPLKTPNVNNIGTGMPPLIQALPRYTRISCNWRPDRLLCKRFGVHDPWEKKVFVDDRPTSELSSSTGISLSSTSKTFAQETVRRAESRSGAFVAGLMNLLGSQGTSVDTPTPPSSTSITTTPPDSSVVEPVVVEDVMTTSSDVVPRPPISIFKSVFGDEDGDEF